MAAWRTGREVGDMWRAREGCFSLPSLGREREQAMRADPRKACLENHKQIFDK